MGRTWRKNSEFSHKDGYKDEQRRLRKEAERAKKNAQTEGKHEQERDVWTQLKKGNHA